MADEKGRLSGAALRHPEVLLATGFGVGLVPVAPGTVGSIVALPVWWWLLADLDLAVVCAVLAVLIVLGSWIIDRACRKTGVGDAGAIVLDEFVGVWIALIAAPKTLLGVAAGFALFRLFDIAKPWPVSWADRDVRGGFGVMLDDVVAGVLAASVLWLAVLALGPETFAASGV
jgi:phosphatidylglycerophosphatase A